MKRLIILLVASVMIFGMSVGNAMAENSLKAGNVGISVGFDSSEIVEGRYFPIDGLALLFGFGYEDHSGDADGTLISFTAGARKYLTTSDFALFADGKLLYETDDRFGGDADTIEISGSFGAEYFFYRQFSVEGSVGVRIGVEDNEITNTEDEYAGTGTAGVRANFYF